MIKKQSQNRIKLIFLLFLFFFSLNSCRSAVPDPILERGKAIDLSKIVFQSTDLELLFSKLPYAKEEKLGPGNKTNTKDNPLLIKWFTLYNITDQPLLARYKKRESYVIQKGATYGDLYSIDRTAPLLGLKNPDLRPFGYWGGKEVAFSRIYTSSTPQNKLIRIRLESGNLHNGGIKEYQALLQTLKSQFKGAKFKEQPQTDGVPHYEWRANDRIVELSFAKADDANFYELHIAYLNSSTKGYLKEFGN